MFNKEIIVRFAKFGFVGSSGILINSSVLWLGHGLFGMPTHLVSPLAIAVAVFTNFNFNNLWTWRDYRVSFKYSYLQRLLRYYISASLGAFLNYTILIVLAEIFSVYYLTANLIGIMAGMLSNFLLGEFWIFTKKN